MTCFSHGDPHGRFLNKYNQKEPIASANYFAFLKSKLVYATKEPIQQPLVLSTTTMGADAEEQERPLLLHSVPVTSALKRTGTVWTAVAHVVTALIGSGVLSLAWCLAQLGWIAGPLVILVFAAIILFSAFLLCDCYRSPDPEHGPDRNPSYLEAVHVSLGKKSAWVCGLLTQISLYGIGIAYTVTSAISMRAIQKSNCYHTEGHQAAACDNGDASFCILLFGVVQLLLSQIPNFHDIQWLSIVAAIMSFTYSFIGFALGLATVIGNGYVKGGISGVTTASAADKMWNVSQALGDVAFSYPYAVILFEVQDTLKAPPSESTTMKKASTVAIISTTFFYLLCGCVGYAAFGDDTPGNLLTGFGFYEPYWLIDFANACIMLHLVGSYQVYSQPLFATVEKLIAEKYRDSSFVDQSVNLKLPFLPAIELNLLRLCFRTLYVISTTLIAMIFPYFNQVIGLIGGLNFWPLSIYFPVQMYSRQKNIQAWTVKWIMLQAFSFLCLIVTAIALIGSLEGLIAARFG